MIRLLNNFKINIALWLLRKEIDDMYMIDVYIVLIIRGSRDITRVPSNLQKLVLDELNAIGLDGYGMPLN